MILFIFTLPVALYLVHKMVFPKTKGVLKPLRIPSDD